MRIRSVRAFAGATFTWLLLVSAGALGQANDNWATRTMIGALPFNVSETLASQATVEATDPEPPCASAVDTGLSHTLWYAYTAGASVEYLTLAVSGSDFIGNITVNTGTPGVFRIVSGGCSGTGSPIPDSTRIVGLRLQPGATVSIMVAARFQLQPGVPIPFSVVASTQYVVSKTDDTRDGACDADCSLREAVDAANDSSGVVLVPPGTYALTRAGAFENNNSTGDLDLRASMAIFGTGPATTIDASQLDRVLDLNPQSSSFRTFSVGGLRLVNGRVSSGGQEGRGGAVRLGNSESYLGFERMVLANNFAAESGGGMYLTSGGRVRESLFTGNEADFAGGGMSYLNSRGKALEIEGSAFIGNDGPQGGGLHIQAEVRISNSTFADNFARLRGGGINVSSSEVFVLASSTVLDNRADDFAFDPSIGAGVRIQTSGPIVITNSVLARNIGFDTPNDCAVFGGLGSRYNHVQAPGDCAFAGPGDVTGTAAGAALFAADNGGPTPTFALLGGSPLLDSGDPAGCTGADGATLLVEDQRGAGFPRVVGASCDRGSLESPLVTPPGAPDLLPASDSGASNADDLTNQALQSFTGACSDGTVIALQADAAPLLPTAPCAGSSYAITLTTPLAEGSRAVTATASNGAGTSLRSGALLVMLDLSAPQAPTITMPPQSQPYDIVVEGTAAEAFGSIVVREAGATRCTATLGAAQTWSCNATLAGAGAHALGATHVDLAGNAGPPSADFTVTISDELLIDGFEDP